MEPRHAPEDATRSRWERLAIPGAVAATWLLALAIDVHPGDCPCHFGITWEWRAALVATIGAVWLLAFGTERVLRQPGWSPEDNRLQASDPSASSLRPDSGQAGQALGLRTWFRGVPRPLFALAVAIPAAALNAARDGALSILFILLAVAWVSEQGSRRESLWALGIAIAATFSYVPDRDVEGQLSVAAAAVCVWLMMRGLRTQRRLVVELRAAQAGLARQAAAAERRRIAGEIHDLAAHSLAVTMLHVTGARLLLRRLRADQRAIDALVEAERSGRQSLDDLRRTVGLLDEGVSSGAAPALPSAASLPALVEEFRAAGLDVSLHVEGDPVSLPAATGLALYRIAQEALANVARHAPGAKVSVHFEVGAGIRLRIRDSGPAPGHSPHALADGGTGHGLGGMRERAALVGGRLTTGPDGAGWAVECVIPGADESTSSAAAGTVHNASEAAPATAAQTV